MAVPNGHAVQPPPIEKRPLILTLGQIRVSLFYATSRKTNAKCCFIGYNPSIYPIGRVDRGRGPQGRIYTYSI